MYSYLPVVDPVNQGFIVLRTERSTLLLWINVNEKSWWVNDTLLLYMYLEEDATYQAYYVQGVLKEI